MKRNHEKPSEETMLVKRPEQDPPLPCHTKSPSPEIYRNVYVLCGVLCMCKRFKNLIILEILYVSPAILNFFNWLLSYKLIKSFETTISFVN